MAHKELFMSWLNDAYATEKALIPILENHAKDAKEHPELQQRLQQHLEETRNQAEMIKGCIERLGGDISKSKSAIGGMFGAMQSISTGLAEDELVKNGIMDYAAEHFEIASYMNLIKGAEQLGDQETVQVCQQILQQEQAMASWLEQHNPMLVEMAMRHKEKA